MPGNNRVHTHFKEGSGDILNGGRELPYRYGIHMIMGKCYDFEPKTGILGTVNAIPWHARHFESMIKNMLSSQAVPEPRY